MTYKRFSKPYLEKIAHEVRTKQAIFDGKRLLIESLVDKLGFELIPKTGLKEELGIEAYLPKRLNTIIVDQASMDFGTPRYFFTLAEEVAHSLIHLKGHGANRDTLYKWIQSLSKSAYEDLERDAKYLAGAILMPKSEFMSIFMKKSAAHRKALGVHGDRHTVIRYSIRRLYMTYCVSFEAAAFRARSLGLIKPSDLAVLGRYRPTAFSNFDS